MPILNTDRLQWHLVCPSKGPSLRTVENAGGSCNLFEDSSDVVARSILRTVRDPPLPRVRLRSPKPAAQAAIGFGRREKSCAPGRPGQARKRFPSSRETGTRLATLGRARGGTSGPDSGGSVSRPGQVEPERLLTQATGPGQAPAALREPLSKYKLPSSLVEVGTGSLLSSLATLDRKASTEATESSASCQGDESFPNWSCRWL